MSELEKKHSYRDRFPDMTDEDFLKTVQLEEAVQAIAVYLRERATKIGPRQNDERTYEHNSHFPFPIAQSAYEIAHLVVNSFYSYEAIETQSTNPET